MANKKILLYGICSLQNRGCEALVNSTIAQFDPTDEIVAATFDYENDKDMYKDKIKKFVNHHKHDENTFSEDEKSEFKKLQQQTFDSNNYETFYQRDVIKEMKNSDYIIHIGGDNYCYGVNEWMYSINNNAKKYNKKTILWGASLYDEINDIELINDLRKYDLLMLREKISYNAVKKFIPEEKLMLIPDPAFSLKPQKITLDKWYTSRKVIGLNLSPLTIKTEKNYSDVKDFIDYILEKTDYSISLIPHVTVSEVNDLNILRRIKEDYSNEDRIFLEEKDYNCQQLKYIISKCELVIAARTHASIAAYSSCVPTLVIGYSVKSRGIAEDLFGNYKDYVLPIDELTKDNLIKYFNYIENNKDTIKKILEKQAKRLSTNAKKIYINMQKKLEELDKKTICSYEKCIGCGACKNICPQGAIEMVTNSEGFLYPKINLKKCINCGLCRKICCRNNEVKKNKSLIKCYAAKSLDKDILSKSSSGGVFKYLAEYIIKENGVVYGATIDNFKVRHIRIDNLKDIKKIQGSKYSQSDISNIYKNIKEDIKNGKKVLFSGTPCQVLAIKKYFGKEEKNLITTSVICHGVLNDKILSKRIKEIENKFETKMNFVKYKSKVNGWDISSIEYDTERLKKAYKFGDDGMMNLYIKNFILRESCYNCPAKDNNNIADIILGDFWGIFNVKSDFFTHTGVSAVILNTNTGKKLFEKIKDNLETLEVNIDDISKYNSSLIESPKRPLERSVIFNDIDENTFSIIDRVYKQEKEKDLKEKLIYLTEKNERLKTDIDNIYNSKRFQFIDKIGNIKNKIIKK